MVEAAFNAGAGIRVESLAELEVAGHQTQDFVMCGGAAAAADAEVLAQELERVLRPGGIAFLAGEIRPAAGGSSERNGSALARPPSAGPEAAAFRVEFRGEDASGRWITVLRKPGMRPALRDGVESRVILNFGPPVVTSAAQAPTSLMKIAPGDETGSHRRYPRWQGVVPLPPEGLMWSAGAPDVENFLVVGDAWTQLVRRHLPPRGIVLDAGCGCGRLARSLIADPAVGGYVGFDCIAASITWCETHVLPAYAGRRCEFHRIDARSAEYNPAGTLRAEDVRFPSGSASFDLVVAASLFTHLLEADAARYLREIARVLKPTGTALITIRATAAAGETYSGNESCIDVDRAHFLAMARSAGLELRDEVADFVGETLLVMGAGVPLPAAIPAEESILSGA
jgi:SAM-dependent methyltransferase